MSGFKQLASFSGRIIIWGIFVPVLLYVVPAEGIALVLRNITSYEITVSASPSPVKLGDPIPVRITIEAVGFWPIYLETSHSIESEPQDTYRLTVKDKAGHRMHTDDQRQQTEEEYTPGSTYSISTSPLVLSRGQTFTESFDLNQEFHLVPGRLIITATTSVHLPFGRDGYFTLPLIPESLKGSPGSAETTVTQ